MGITVDSLPRLDDAFALPADAITAYRKRGWTLVRDLCHANEIAVYGDAIKEATIANNNETRPIEERDTYGRAFLQTTNLWQMDKRVAEYTLSKRFASVAAQLLGVDRVRLYHDQSLFKEPGGGHTPWHQDGWYWPVRHDRSVTMWMPLVDISAEMGSMSFADGSNLAGLIDLGGQISDQSEAFFDGFVMGRRLPITTSGPMKAGDATFHSGLTLHRAPGNPTNQVRAVMTVIYLADGEVVQTPRNPNQENDLRVWFPGLKAGDPVASPLNPMI
ncbi:MAG: phytanoyl-CoA dioxygenase family protein [Fimbriimonadaceae bacterium]